MKKLLLVIVIFLVLAFVLINRDQQISPLSNYYHLNGSEIIYKTYNFLSSDSVTVTGADVTTFEVISHAWAKDAYRVYFTDQATPFDPKTFKKLGCFYVDKTGVYVFGEEPYLKPVTFLKTSADPASFTPILRYKQDEILPDDCLGKDEKHVYVRATIATGTDPATYTHLNHSWSKDKNYVYAGDLIKTDLDPTHFEAAGSHLYGKDKQFVYVFDYTAKTPLVVEGADPTTFEYVSSSYSQNSEMVTGRDKNNLYFRERIIRPKTE